jgi:ketosteroid isomerase-like protein
MAAESSAADNKALVQKWLSQGVSSPASRAMVTDDFTWTGPASLGLLHEDGSGVIRGADALVDIPNLDKAIYRGYEVDTNNSNVHFMIAEGDTVVMEFDAAFTTFEGEPYHNQYCLVFICRDGKIAEVREHVDSHYSWEVVLGTPEKRAGVLERLERLRAGESL